MKAPLSCALACFSLVAMVLVPSSVDARITLPRSLNANLIHPQVTPLETVVKLRGGASVSRKTSTNKRASTSSASADTKGTVLQKAKPALLVLLIAAIAGGVVNSDLSNNEYVKTISSALSSTRAKLLVLMVFQNACTVLLGRYTRSSTTKSNMYVINHLVLMCELVKCILSCILEYRATNGKLWQSIDEHIIKNPMNSVKIIIPSLLYLVQNSLQYVALSNLSAPLFQVTYQAKLLTTALASVLMLQRRYKAKQWVCLVTLGIGVAIVVLGESSSSSSSAASKKKKKQKAAKDDDHHEQHLVVGLTAVTVACVSSALASVYLEKVLKKKPVVADAAASKPVSLWMFNLQMAFFSACIAAVKEKNVTVDDKTKPFLHGFTPWVWLLVLLQAGGGMLVAAVMKYADNVLKGLATGVSVVVSTSVSMLLFGTPITGQFSVGAFFILASVYYFSN